MLQTADRYAVLPYVCHSCVKAEISAEVRATAKNALTNNRLSKRFFCIKSALPTVV
jgi:hypothetical protein